MKEIVIAAIAGGLAREIIMFIRTKFFKSKSEVKKEKEEAVGSELDNVSKAVEIWRKLSEGQLKEIQNLKDEVEKLRREVHELERLKNQKCETCQFKLGYDKHKSDSIRA